MTDSETEAFKRWCVENHDVVIDHWDGYDRKEVARLAWEAGWSAKHMEAKQQRDEILRVLNWARSCVPYPSDCHKAIVALQAALTSQGTGGANG